jgi:membrane protease YdiL (CAAX protease family)
MSRRRAQLASPIDTYLAFLALLGLAVATFQMDLETRYVLLWCALLAADYFYLTRPGGINTPRPPRSSEPFADLGHGAAIGLLISLPILLFAEPWLTTQGALLLPATSLAALFQGFVLIGPFAEEQFFRGQLQRQHGLIAGAATYGLYQILLFLPVLYDSAVLGLSLAAIGVALGFLYGYVYKRYGLAASIACHMVINLMILFLPPLIQESAALFH